MSGQKRKLSSRNTSGYNGVSKKGERFRAQIYANKTMKTLGTYDTPKEAALAYDRAVVQHKLSSSKLNYPDGLPIDDEDYEELMNPKKKNRTKKRRLRSTNTTGYNGVYKTGKRFIAQISIGGKQKSLGTYATPKEAALAFDQAIIQHKLSSSRLNFPNDYTTSSEDDESSEEESEDDSSSSDSSHSSDDDESDDEEDAVEPPPSPQAQPQFVREPMLDQMAADAQNKKQEEEQQQVEVEEQHVDVEEEDSGCDSDSFWL
jgi:hypothetical protein